MKNTIENTEIEIYGGAVIKFYLESDRFRCMHILLDPLPQICSTEETFFNVQKEL